MKVERHQSLLEKDQLSELVRYAGKHNMRLYDVLERLGNHVMKMKYIEETKLNFKIMALFRQFEVSSDEDYSKIQLTVSVFDNFDYILNKLNFNFKKFDLNDFLSLKSTYSKQMY
jgi:plasmid replication initiation protein